MSAKFPAAESDPTAIHQSALDTDSTFAANSDARVPSQKAVKTAVDAQAVLVESAVSQDGGSTIQPTSDTFAVKLLPYASQSQAVALLDIGSVDSGGYAKFDRRARLRIKADPGEHTGDGDAVGTLTLENLTQYAFDGGAPGWGPTLNWLVNGTFRWQTGMDAYGMDFVLAYNKGTTRATTVAGGGPHTGVSGDTVYLTAEDYPRIGLNSSNPTATLHVEGAPHSAIDRPVSVMKAQTGHAVAIEEWQVNGQAVAWVWKGGQLVIPAAPTTAAAPTDSDALLQVSGVARVNALRLVNGSYTDYALNQTSPMLYATGSGGSGVYPFSASGNLILQPRTNTGGATGDIVLAAGDAQVPRIVAQGASGANVGLHPDPAAPTALYGGGTRVLGLRYGTAPSNGGSSTRPANGVAIWSAGNELHVMEPNGSVVRLGNAASGGASIRFTATGSSTTDCMIGRKAAGSLETNSDLVFITSGKYLQWGNAANEQTTVGAAGAASALPASPTKYLKVKDSAGTVYVIPAFAAS